MISTFPEISLEVVFEGPGSAIDGVRIAHIANAKVALAREGDQYAEC